MSELLDKSVFFDNLTSEILDEINIECEFNEAIWHQQKIHLQTSQPVIIGVDEAGRGPLLGSVVIGAAILSPKVSKNFEQVDLTDTVYKELNDSKKISEKKRERLFPIIKQHAIGYAIVEIPAKVIDEINILQASLLGMRIASNVLINKLLSADSEHITQNHMNIQTLYDGNKVPRYLSKAFSQFTVSDDCMNVDMMDLAVVKGDATHVSIAAASILAKVHRDDLMYKMASIYPEYAIEQHKGYPTKLHLQKIEELDVLPEHRRSFAPIKKKFATKKNVTQ